MHELTERAELVRLHSRAQGLSVAATERVLARIDTLDDGPTGWSTVWAEDARRSAAAGRTPDAVARYNLARFPFPHTPDGRAAHRRCVDLAADLLARRGAARIEVDGTAAWHLPAPDAADAPRLLVVCGGIVSIKEQWIGLAGLARRMSMGLLLTELPGVGENSARYGADAGARFGALLDAAAARERFSAAFALALSFGGTVALHAAAADRRIGGVASVGPPVRHFFEDMQWWSRVPQTTKDALAVTTGVAERDLPAALPALALTRGQLGDVRIPVTSVASLRDEIIPAADPIVLREELPDVRVVAFDDVHGSPAHLLDTRLLTMSALAAFASPPRPLLGRAARAALRVRRSERSLVGDREGAHR
ncbi:alpha/beta hydrolase [Rhodococcus rhodnii]|uniref:Alpha/beta hydrolase n=2 Tax=Rhodococcus rhodnii TaxID=38312 RepID=R7WPP9_9NOCA|nr:hypothetical protein [Rhodococcus rhodnii]EOM77250.1 hypothetical protein Rrhod_1399 [Rhodococcus rhodnii LMG 5362]TXG90158.1 alpha/beta hydrolase [Rhodococcus rhodnii]